MAAQHNTPQEPLALNQGKLAQIPAVKPQHVEREEVLWPAFAGPGTTLLQAQSLNYDFIRFDIQQESVDLANHRLKTNVIATLSYRCFATIVRTGSLGQERR